LHLHLNHLPNVDTGPMHILEVILAGGVLVLGLWPMARGLAGLPAARCAALGSFVFLAQGVNTILDGLIYMTMFQGAVASNALMYGLEAIMLGCALGICFGQTGQPGGFPRRNWMAWTGRGLIAWLAWPVVYFSFGACIAPIVVPYYTNGSMPWLHLPPTSTIFVMQLVRSAIFLVASLPLIALWKGSRRGLWLGLGLAHAVTVGIYGLVAATFLPLAMRIAHGVEITCDSFVYAGLLVLLFGVSAAAKTTPAAERRDAPLHAL